jgi:hypothetical protein
MSDEAVLEQIRRTLRSYGAVYPVLVDQDGRLIDGAHRLKVWPKWPKVVMKNVKTPYDLLAVRVLANTARRTVSEQERVREIRKMGGFLEKMGLKTKDEQARKISQDTGLSETYVRRLLEEPIRDVLTKPPRGA